uniref:Snake toxin/toxin-like domain-containing protein n=1 Tax=Seriola dumerili TaxID=41447 RepID=A0A3B4VAU6_SERDU
KMKALQLACVLLVVSVALKCNRCVPYSARGSCTNTVETCQRSDDVCASHVHIVLLFTTESSYFKRCMKRSDAFILQSTPNFQVFTCDTDLCN